MTGLARLASAVVPADETVPNVPGFLLSAFAPRVCAAARRCLAEVDPSVLAAVPGERIGIVLGSTFGDTTTMEAVGEQLADTSGVQPLLFHQAVWTPVLGVLAREHGITGPISCVSVPADLDEETFAVAELQIEDDDVDLALVLVADLPATERVREWLRRLADDGLAGDGPDGTTTATLVAREVSDGVVRCGR